MTQQEKQDLQAMLFAIYKKLLEIEARQKGQGVSLPAWSVIKDLQAEADKIKIELGKNG